MRSQGAERPVAAGDERTRLTRMGHVRNVPVFAWWDYPIFGVLTVVTSACILWLLTYWFSRDDWLRHPSLMVIFTFALLMPLPSHQARWFSLPLMRRPIPMAPAGSWRVGVATTIVPGSESLEMLAETVRALVAMDYPHDTWVLDEGDDERVKDLCRRLGARHFTRKHLPRYQTEAGVFQGRSKHGNYNAWLHEVGFDAYDICVSFDPDHVPRRDFLTRTLGYFEDDTIGYVQAAQAYYNQSASFIARGAAEETYAYYSSIQMTSYAMGYPIVTGCHTVHRMSALREVGGFAAHDADDMLLTIHYRVGEWRGVYVPEILARGLTPVDWRGYLTQQRRWARSVLDIKFRIYPKLARRLPALERVISFAHGLYYLHGLATAIGLMALIVYNVTGARIDAVASMGGRLALVYLAMELCDLYRQRFYLDPRQERGLPWRAHVLQFAKWPFVLLALLECISGRRFPYQLTPKVRDTGGGLMLAPPHLIAAALVAASAAAGWATHPAADLWPLAISAILVLVSLAVASSEHIDFPPSFDPALAASMPPPTSSPSRSVAESGA